MNRGILALAAGAALFVACDDDPTKVVCGDCGEAPPLAVSEDELVRLFESAWAERNLAEYERLLADDFQFWFAPEDVDLAPNGMYWDRPTDLASTARMFGGEEGQRPDGSRQPPVQRITLTLTPADADWINAGGETIGGVTTVPDGARKRRYDVDMRVTYTLGDIVSEVGGQELLYVVPHEIVVDDDTVTEWRLAIWRDFGSVAKTSTENASWGAIKALY